MATSLVTDRLLKPMRDSLMAKAMRETGMLHAGEVRSRLGIDRATLAELQRSLAILAVRTPSTLWRYPAWQVAGRNPLQGIRAVRQALLSGDCWVHWCFFELRQQSLDGRTPVEALQAGDVDAVVRAARAFQTPAGVFV